MGPTIGDHIADRRRKRSLTQEELAERAGVSVETIRKLEQNERTTARMSTLYRIAQALDVPTSALFGDAARTMAEREPDDDQLSLMDLRRALTPARGLHGLVIGTPEGDPFSLAQLRAAISGVDRAYHADDYTTTIADLPDLLVNARHATDAARGSDQHAPLSAALAGAYRIAGKTLLQVRNVDLAHRALSLALTAADESGDDLVGGGVVASMCWLLIRQGRFAEAERLAVVTADGIEPRFSRPDPPRLAAWGWLLLYAAGSAARDNRLDDAVTLLDGAEAAAVRIGEHTANLRGELRGFSRAKVAMMRVEAAVVAGDAAKALTLAQRIPPGWTTPSCRHRHRLDVACALAQTGSWADATAVLTELKAQAPTWLRHQRYARDIVTAIAAGKKRAISKELAELAALVGADF